MLRGWILVLSLVWLPLSAEAQIEFCGKILSPETYEDVIKFESPDGESYYKSPFTSPDVMNIVFKYNELGTQIDKLKEDRKKLASIYWLERSKLRKEIKSLEAQQAEVKTLYAEAIKAETEVLRNTFKRILPDTPTLDEFMNYFKIQTLGSKKTVTLAFGTPGQTEQVPGLAHEIAVLAANLKDRGYTLLFEAGTPYTEVIAAQAQESGVLLSPDFIKDPYLRFLAFSIPTRVVVGPDSLTGLGLVLFGRAHVMLDPEKRLNTLGAKPSWPASWTKALKTGGEGLDFKLSQVASRANALEILSHRYNEVVKKGKEGEKPKEKKPVDMFPFIDPAKTAKYREKALNLTVDDLEHSQLRGALNDTYARLSGQTILKSQLKGAVVFGSATAPHVNFNHRAYEALTSMGAQNIPITTGGAGGMMRLGNAAAFEAGTQSIGIPIGGRDPKSDEARVYSEIHTKTFPVPYYASRIPLLLEGKPLVIIMPGRGGTMREVGATFMQILNQGAEGQTQIIFFGRDYYAGLMAGVGVLELPTSIKERLHLVDNGQELTALITSLIEQGKVNSNQIFSTEAITPQVLSKEDKSFLEEQKKEDGKPGEEKQPD